ncbi:GNAT family N-acetyltransferase [Mycobacterium sp. Aquia_213]|uniref:GNAT family N-acetyltransferase n=1 Tax=Mycobacterium sp. Aquia_213 TaxID=2991728 RepID=UPI00226F56B4|nr:GNAT family N-acetyltransferase [Mycobacterium sp. Aquia_213]WAC93822.1 GNAT family N-acetyltransferase [Mycobacterium sp. Aquia_213]
MVDRLVEFAATAQLLDGRLISLRRLNADDTTAALALHQHLSDFDRYFRFFTLNQIDLDKLVGKMTEPAPGQYALGAFDGERLLGVAHYKVVGNDPKVAEIAVVVAHEDHSVGVGTALLKRLAQIARPHGICRFVADVLGENHLMLKVLFDLGYPCEPIGYGSVRHVEIELPDFVAEMPTAAKSVP